MSSGSAKRRSGKSPSKPGGGDAGDIRERVVRLETKMENVATEADIEKSILV